MLDILTDLKNNERLVGVVGLGYVGLPLACLFAEKGFNVLGYDVNTDKIASLKGRCDPTHQVSSIPEGMTFSADPTNLRRCALVLICVPTPRDGDKVNTSIVEAASKSVAENLSPGTIVCYESSVYPGLTEELVRKCFQHVKDASGKTLRIGLDFHICYSPERINPGDKTHTLGKINKLVSGDSKDSANALAAVYREVLDADVHICPSIKVAEMAKIYENIQRAAIIALANELAFHCKELGIESKDVLDACATKWNFVNLRPGIVAGDCLPVNPVYYLSTQKGFDLKVVREIKNMNDAVPKWIALELIKKCPDMKMIGFFGAAYKENIGDFRHSGAFAIKSHIWNADEDQFVFHDPHVDSVLFEQMYGYEVLASLAGIEDASLSAAVVCVGHNEYKEAAFLEHLSQKLIKGAWIFDIKGTLNKQQCAALGFNYWQM